MNWSLGFFRLWLLISGLWVLGWAIGGWMSLLDPHRVTYVVGKEGQINRIDFTDRDAIKELARRGELKLAATQSGTTYYSLPRIAEETSDLSQRVDARFRKEQWNEAISLAPGWLLATFGVPIVFLAMGFALKWVFNGFRSRAQNP